MSGHGSIQNKYLTMEIDRNEFDARGLEVSQLTIPYVFLDRDNNFGKEGELVNPSNSLGARACSVLASKLQQTLFPTRQPFFKYTLDDATLATLGEQRGAVEQIMSDMTRLLQQFMNKSNLKSEMPDLILKLIITGNGVAYVKPDGMVNIYGLDNFVAHRDRDGHIYRVIVKETFVKSTLPEEVMDVVQHHEDYTNSSKDIDIFTGIWLNSEGRIETIQECCGFKIDSTRTKFPKGVNPWIIPRMIKVSGENYGRSYAEQFLGDLRMLDGGTESINDFAAAASRGIVLVKPSAVTNLQDLNSAPNGSFVQGKADDFEPLTIPFNNDYNTVSNTMKGVEQRISDAFLLFTARDAERTTAEEIRMDAEQLNAALNGIYSILERELQLPIVKAFEYRLKKAGGFKDAGLLPPEELDVDIVSGIDALSRGQDISNLNGFISDIAQLQQAGIDLVSKLNTDELIRRLSAARGIDDRGLVKTQQQIQAEKQQQMGMQMLDGPAGKALGEIAVNNNDPEKVAKAQQIQENI